MTKPIIWSPLAERDLETVLDYLMKNWNKEVAISFIDIIEHLIDQIEHHPKQFPLVNKKRHIRKCVATKHNTIFYRENKGAIEILRVFDTRQHPFKRTYK